MKKIYSYIFLSALSVLFSVNARAGLWNVTVNSFSFSPNSLPGVECGDTVKWTYGSGNPHTTTSTTIPAGAPSWNAPINSTTNTTFQYVVPSIPGVYNYVCTTHGFSGSFTVTCPTGIDEARASISLLVYPNPFVSSITIVSHDADALKVMDINGRLVDVLSLNISGGKSEINLDTLAPGVYFLSTWNEGVIRRVEKIVKVK